MPPGPFRTYMTKQSFRSSRGPWLSNTATAKWIAPRFNTVGSAGGAGAAGDYTYQLDFDLTGLRPETAEISGDWASDNGGIEILLNGVNVSGGNGGFGSLTAFNIPVGSPFMDGVNSLQFRLNNASDGYTALFVDNLSGTAMLTPEPAGVAIWALLGLAGAGFAYCRRRRR